MPVLNAASLMKALLGGESPLSTSGTRAGLTSHFRYKEVIEWDVTLFTWMESAATYLRCVDTAPECRTFYSLVDRDWSTILGTIQAAREGRDDDAMRTLQWSDAEIQKIVRLSAEPCSK